MKVIIDIDNTLSIATDRFKMAEKENGKTDTSILLIHGIQALKKNQSNSGISFECIKISGSP